MRVRARICATNHCNKPSNESSIIRSTIYSVILTTIPEKAILNSKVHKSLKNWIDHWRPKVATHLSEDALFLHSSGKAFTVRHLGHNLSKYGKKIWNNYHPYTMRHWCAVARLAKSKNETGNFDCFHLKNCLGHERMATTEGYIKHAEKYYRDFPVD
ncbi:MAG: hypothetical protein KAR64_01300 [Thermoplasmatales archaeon]|nr:hypothetical protein [Thermoplasmatales archaeon]